MLIITLSVAYLLYAVGARWIVRGVLDRNWLFDFAGHSLSMAAGAVVVLFLALYPVFSFFQTYISDSSTMYSAASMALLACCLGEWFYSRVMHSAVSALRLRLPQTFEKE